MKINVKLLGMALASIRGVFPKLMGDRFRKAEIPYTFDQMIVLMVVRHAPQAQQEIAEKLRKDKSLILRIVDLLENDGLVCRMTDSSDRRRNIINLTDKGFEYTERFREIESDISIELYKGLEQEEVETFFKVINHIRKRAEDI